MIYIWWVIYIQWVIVSYIYEATSNTGRLLPKIENWRFSILVPGTKLNNLFMNINFWGVPDSSLDLVCHS